MNKPTLMALGMMAALFAAVGVGPAPQVFAQYFGGGSEPLTQEQLDKCAQYQITPCTQNSILAKERLIQAQANPASGSGTPYFDPSKPEGSFAIVGALGAIFGGVAAMFFLRGRGAKPVTT
jgi:hypothetical protein